MMQEDDNTGCTFKSTQAIHIGEEATTWYGVDGDTNLLSMFGFSEGEPNSAFRLYPPLHASDVIGHCLEMHQSGFTLNETTGGYPGSDQMTCIRIGHFGNEMLKRALDAGYFKRGGVPFHKVDGKVKWRNAERHTHRDIRRQCRE